MNRITVLVIVLLLVGWPLAGVIPGGAVTEPNSVSIQPDLEGGDQFSEVEDGSLEVWERSLLPLRAPAEDAATSIPVEDAGGHDLTIQTDSGDSPSTNRDFVGVYDRSNQPITLEYGPTQFSDTTQFEDEDVQVVVAQFNDNTQSSADVGGLDAIGDVINPGLEGDFDELQNQAEQRGITFDVRPASEVGSVDSDGEISFDLEKKTSGPYAVMLAIPQNGDGFTTRSGEENPDLDILTLTGDDQATIIGVETLLLQEQSSSMEYPDAIAPGDDIEVDYSTGLNADSTTQSVLVYNEETFFEEETNIDVNGELGSGLSTSDITLEHSIAEVNGVGEMTQDGNVFGTDASQRIISGTTPLGDIVDQLSDEAGVDNQRDEIGDTVLDASGVTDPEASPDDTVTIQTNDDWAPGQYRVIHAAEDGTVGGIETTTDTISVYTVEGLTLELGSTVIEEGDGETTATALIQRTDGVEEDRTDDAVFESSNPNVATIDRDDGTIQAGEAGTTTITATFDEGPAGNTVEASAELTVGTVEDLDLSLNQDRIRFTVEDGTVTSRQEAGVESVTATFVDGTTEDVTTRQDVSFETSDDDVVNIEDDSPITITPTGENATTATIEASYQNEQATAEISVTRRVVETVQGDSLSSGSTESLDEVTFDEANLDGAEATIDESDCPGQQVSNAIDNQATNFQPAASVEINIDGAENEGATLRVRVPKSEVDDRDSVTTYRVPSGADEAEELETEPIGEDGDDLVFEFTTPGFSTFVLGASEASGPTSPGGGGGGGSGGLSPSITASTGISDVSPGTPGTTVEFSNGVVNAITFSGEDVEGRVEVDDYGTNLPPGSPSTGDRPVFGSAEITVPNSVTDEPATIRMTVDQTELLRAGAGAEDIAIFRGTGGGYQMLDTTAVDSNGDVTVEAETPGFSTFIVSTDEGDIGLDDDADAATDTPDEGTPADDGDEPAAGTDTPAEGTPPSDSDDLPGFGVPIALVALLAAALLAARHNASE